MTARNQLYLKKLYHILSYISGASAGNTHNFGVVFTNKPVKVGETDSEKENDCWVITSYE